MKINFVSFRLNVVALSVLLLLLVCKQTQADHIKELQTEAVKNQFSKVAHWGNDPGNYTMWSSHSNRLIPVFTFGTLGAGKGIDLNDYIGSNSPYRSPQAMKNLYGQVPSNTLNPNANYFDQSDIGNIQRAALQAGKKHLFLVIFDGMDWQTSRAAAIVKSGQVAYQSGKGTGLYFQNYSAAGTAQFGYFVTSPRRASASTNVDQQQILKLTGLSGGYNSQKAGDYPWSTETDKWYLIGKENGSKQGGHAYADSAGTASAMTTGIKTYNGSINVDIAGNQLATVAHLAQEKGFSVGAVTSVPLSHATPAAAYAHNVSRNDYQDLTRDLIGLRSSSHPNKPLLGLDVVLGGGWGIDAKTSSKQGKNFVPGELYFSHADIEQVSVKRGGKYQTATRTPGKNGNKLLQVATKQAVKNNKRLLGIFGIGKYMGHLPYQTADGDYQPAPGRSGSAEKYSSADLNENPTLPQMTDAAITVLSQNKKGFWLMVEAGDVDWANHDNNLDNSIGAVFSGESAVKTITNWVEMNSSWQESLLIVTADHGHYLVLTNPAGLLPPSK